MNNVSTLYKTCLLFAEKDEQEGGGEGEGDGRGVHGDGDTDGRDGTRLCRQVPRPSYLATKLSSYLSVYLSIFVNFIDIIICIEKLIDG